MMRVGARTLLGQLGFGRFLWGRSADDLTVTVVDPVGRGLLRDVPGKPRPAQLVMRPVFGRDHERVDDVRRANWGWLSPWEPTLPPESTEALPNVREFARRSDEQQRLGESLMMMAELDGEVAGIVSVSNVHRGAACSCSIGYWVVASHVRRSLGSLMVAITIDLLLGELGMHRVEITVRPENERSLGLCRKLGLMEEGYKKRFLHIAGEWADHMAFAIDTESLPEGGMVRHYWGQSVL